MTLQVIVLVLQHYEYNTTLLYRYGIGLVTAGASDEKPVEFRRRPEPEYNPFASDDVPKTAHRLEVVEVKGIVSLFVE